MNLKITKFVNITKVSSPPGFPIPRIFHGSHYYLIKQYASPSPPPKRHIYSTHLSSVYSADDKSYIAVPKLYSWNLNCAGTLMCGTRTS